MINNPIKQHTVPCSYLRFFWIKDKWRKTKIYSLFIKFKKIEEIPINKLSIKKDFYTIKFNWKTTYSIEKYFSDNLENNIPWIIKKLTLNKEITNEEKILFSNFIIFQEMRSIWRRKNHNLFINEIITSIIREYYLNIKNKEERILFFQKFIKKDFYIELSINNIEQIFNSYEKGESIKLDADNLANIWMMNIAADIWKYLLNRKWEIIDITKSNSNFLVSDSPVFIENWFWFWTSKYIWFPLGSHHALLITNYWDNSIHYSKIEDENFINIFNERIIEYSVNFIASRNKKQIINISKKLKKENS